jgi:hypothetical protein
MSVARQKGSQEEDMGTGSHEVWMVIAEHGSEWAGWADQFRHHPGDVVVVLQQKDEPLAEFATRVRTRVERVTQSLRRSVQRAVIVGGRSSNPSALPARGTIIKALVSGMAEKGGGELLLAGPESDRLMMRALAATVADLSKGTGVRVEPAPPVARVA